MLFTNTVGLHGWVTLSSVILMLVIVLVTLWSPRDNRISLFTTVVLAVVFIRLLYYTQMWLISGN